MCKHVSKITFDKNVDKVLLFLMRKTNNIDLRVYYTYDESRPVTRYIKKRITEHGRLS